MKKLFSFVLALSMALALTACGGSADTDSTTTDDTAETTAEPVELHVFAAASMQESLDQVIKAGWDVGVAWQDGRAFHGPCHIRMNLASPLSRIQEAFDRLDKYVFNA